MKIFIVGIIALVLLLIVAGFVCAILEKLDHNKESLGTLWKKNMIDMVSTPPSDDTYYDFFDDDDE